MSKWLEYGKRTDFIIQPCTVWDLRIGTWTFHVQKTEPWEDGGLWIRDWRNGCIPLFHGRIHLLWGRW